MKPTFNLEAEAEKLSWPVDGYNYTKVIAENDAIDLAHRYAEAQQTDKTLREALQKYASAKVTCEFIDEDSRTFEVHENCEKWAQDALTGGKAGE